MLVCVDPRGSVPLSFVNFVTTGSLVKKVKSFQRFFVERKAKDGSDNNGVWPAGDEADYAFTSELGGGERRASLGAVKLLTDRIESLQTKGADGAEVVPGTSRCRFDISARTINDVRVWVGRIFFVLGAAIMVCINVVASHQRGVCEEEFGACAWGRIEHQLYGRERASEASERASSDTHPLCARFLRALRHLTPLRPAGTSETAFSAAAYAASAWIEIRTGTPGNSTRAAAAWRSSGGNGTTRSPTLRCST